MILGIETSCDDTSVALICQSKGREGGGDIVAHRRLSQITEHAEFGGVVPEIAARSHLRAVNQLIREVMAEAGVDFADLSAVAATAGPGLIGGLSVGVMTGKAIAYATGKPFIGVNHLQGHALTVRLTHNIAFPYLLLLVSGGHCQFLWVKGVADYKKLGDTLDDAIGEAFDKTAKLLGLPYPGGPAIEQWALSGDSQKFALPRPLLGDKERACDFSLSGLKSSVRRLVVESLEKYGEPLPDSLIADIVASFQAAVGDIMCDRTNNALDKARRLLRGKKPVFVTAGGVAANKYLCGRLRGVCRDKGWEFVSPPQELCTDNGAMIGWVGVERLRQGDIDDLQCAPRPRWNLEELR